MFFVSKYGKYIEIKRSNYINDIEYIKEILKVKNINLYSKNDNKNDISNHILDISKKKVEIM
tara:strand:- start:86 stop:271 length:186 start_codon:yes stop_codon:yes gene_type:complete